MPLVVDASVALAWGLPDESSAYADAVLAVVEQEGLACSRTLGAGDCERSCGRLSAQAHHSTDEQVFLAALSHLSIEVEAASPLTVVRDGTAAAMRYGLTAYDAAYVDLASRERLALATLDGPMRKAAEQAGVTIFRW